MNEISFPPNLKPGKAGGHTEYVYVCPLCHSIHWITYNINEVVHGINSNSWRQVSIKACFSIQCTKCRGGFQLATRRADCALCFRRLECLMQGVASIINRKVYKPYSTIYPKRKTIWE